MIVTVIGLLIGLLVLGAGIGLVIAVAAASRLFVIL